MDMYEGDTPHLLRGKHDTRKQVTVHTLRKREEKMSEISQRWDK